MQLSFIEQMPSVSKTYFLDVFAEAFCDIKSNKMKLKTINGQQVPEDMKVRVPSKFISKFPEGTIVKIDTKLVAKDGKIPYFVAVKSNKVQRAIEYFEYNLKLQYGFDFRFISKKMA